MKTSTLFIVGMFTALLMAAVLYFYEREGAGWFLFFAILVGGAASDAHARETGRDVP